MSALSPLPKDTNLVPSGISEFLLCETPQEWLELAVERLDELLIDHANCEKKAASTALSLMFRYDCYADICYRMSRLAREELRHYEQVLKIIEQRQIKLKPVKPSRYAGGLHQHVAKFDPQRLPELLIIGGIIEARSCERFARIIPYLESAEELELAKFYRGLLASEARHFQHYLELARKYWKDNELTGPFSEKVKDFLSIERELIMSSDISFNFHSGVFQFNRR